MGKTLFFFGFFEEELFEFLHLLRVLVGEVVHLGVVLSQVVEFPLVFVGVPGLEVGIAARNHGMSGPKVQAYQPSW